jgi:hypothetical protein
MWAPQLSVIFWACNRPELGFDLPSPLYTRTFIRTSSINAADISRVQPLSKKKKVLQIKTHMDTVFFSFVN